MSGLAGKRVLLIISGGIAAFKAMALVRMLRRAGAGMTCVLTRNGGQFVTPLSLQALSESKVYTDLFSLTDESEMGHIQLSRSADLLVVMPASADLLARMAAGMADDLAATVLLATDKPVMVAPAMNVRMWLHPATQANMATLVARGVHVVGPVEGAMACNEFGFGRMSEPEAILAAIEALLAGPGTGLFPASELRAGALPPGGLPQVGLSQTGLPLASPPPAGFPSAALPLADLPLAGKHALVTAGPTHEPIDPVRYLANRSSGRQGYAIAAALAAFGARVTLVSGPVALSAPAGITLRRVETAQQMLAACEGALPADVAVFAAAVADWRVANTAGGKIKKRPGAAPPALELVPNPDILATIAAAGPRRPRMVVGFAAETDDLLANAQAKRARKNADWIVANDVSPATGIMGGVENAVHLVTAGGVEDWPRLPKDEVAQRIAARIAEALR